VNNRQSTADFRGVAAEFEPSLEGEVGDPLGSLASGGTPTPPAPSVQSEAAHRPVSVSSSVMEALLINRVEPAYPAIARTTRTSGAVVLSAVIAADGTIQSLRVVSGSPLLTVAATAAVREWRFKPMLLDGQPIEVQTLITINFVLD
jgi:protein TonB